MLLQADDTAHTLPWPYIQHSQNTAEQMSHPNFHLGKLEPRFRRRIRQRNRTGEGVDLEGSGEDVQSGIAEGLSKRETEVVRKPRNSPVMVLSPNLRAFRLEFRERT